MGNKSFDFGKPTMESEWLVEDMIPLGHLVFNLAKSGSGKSFFVEGLAVNIVHGQNFLGKLTVHGDALLIDQDTPRDILERRLKQFAAGLGLKPAYKLHLYSQENLYLDYKRQIPESSLMETINNHPKVVLVVIDSLHSVCNNLDTDKVKSMSILAKLKRDCLKPNLTIMINHHISDKGTMTAAEMMKCEPRGLAMGSSVINQQADTYFIMSNPKQGKLEELYLRPVAKRQSLTDKPLKLRLKECGSTLLWQMGEEWVDEEDECEKDILNLAEQFEQGDPLTVREVHEQFKGLYGINRLRNCMAMMEKKGYFKRRKGQANMFLYYQSNEPVSIRPRDFV